MAKGIKNVAKRLKLCRKVKPAASWECRTLEAMEYETGFW